MDADWIKSPVARRVLAHWADPRPTWLWSHDGARLLWRNDAARFFRSKIKKHTLRLAPEAVPIRGLVSRLVRLGSPGRSSLSRIQFLSGDKPVSTTCACTPLQLPGELALLIVAVDPIEADLLVAEPHHAPDATTLKALPAGADFLVIDDDSRIAGGTAGAMARYAEVVESEGIPQLPEGRSGHVSIAGEQVLLTRYQASPNDAILLVFEAPSDTGTSPARPDSQHPSPEREPLLPLGLPRAAGDQLEQTASDGDHWVEPLPETDPDQRSLTSLFDRLVDDPELYTPLTVADERFAGPAPRASVEQVTEEVSVAGVREDEGVDPQIHTAEDDVPSDAPAPTNDPIADIIAAASEETAESEEPAPPPALWRVTGRGLAVTRVETDIASPEAAPVLEQPAPEEPAGVSDPETMERVSRYNFDELSRILSDRVGRAAGEESPAPRPSPAGAADGTLVNLTGETFILNRLPIGILVFRDQQVLFANRALIELTGHESVEGVRNGGLAAVFPAIDAMAGPVTQLLRRDGTLVPVSARLQSIAWNGRPALMLSANRAEPTTGHESAVRAFAALAADTAEDGFLAIDRSGVISDASLQASVLLGQASETLIGRPIATLIAPAQLGELRSFLELPARFAETSRPALRVALSQPALWLNLFSEGQAGIVAGYFGFVRRKPNILPSSQTLKDETQDVVEPTMLARMSRSLRRPLNSIIGFADLLSGGVDVPVERQAEYTRDIKTAGQEIAALVDELDDYARLQEGRYPSQPGDVDLGILLESCLVRVKSQAMAARVLVRNAISEQLPSIVADKASLTQAVLNLLASAIDQTPAGGSVILSAQAEDDGGITVNLRDGGATHRDFGDRFMVFRDGTGRDGNLQRPVRSGVGLALTRSLLAVNALSLSVDPTLGSGTLFSLTIPADKVARQP